ncbi:GTPase [Veillonella sp. AM51-8BH]
MEQTPKANRVHIGFFGRCNAGKSTLINMLTDQLYPLYLRWQEQRQTQ